MKLILVLLISVSLGGCGLFNRTESEHGAISGQLNGQPIQVEWERNEEGRVALEVHPLAQAAAGLLPSPWGDLLTLGMTLLGGGGLMAARANARRADEHKADAEEGWNRALNKSP